MYCRRKILKQSIIIIITGILFVLMIRYYFDKEKTEEISVGNEEERQSYFEDVFLCGCQDTFQKIKFFEAEEGSYYVFMPSEMRTDVYVEFDKFKELQIGNTIYSSGAELTDIYNPEPYRMLARDWDGNVIEEATIHFYFSVDVPSIYIETVTGTLDKVNAEKGVKEKARYTTVSESGIKDASGNCTIKARGNTSFQYEQKSYSINLEENQSVLGMSSASEWALLANYKNTIQQLKNKIALDIAGMFGMQFTPEGQFVNVFIDHQYNGLYLLTQKVSADGGAVQIENQENGKRKITGSYLMEFDARYKEEPVWFSTRTANIVLKFPKNITDEQKDDISSYMLEAEEALFSDTGINPLSGKSYKEYLDLDSWLGMYLMQEFFVQWDVEFSSFFLYKMTDDPYIYAGPIWDFDLTCGEISSGYYPKLTQKTLLIQDNREGWLRSLGMKPEFQSDLREKYEKEFAPVIEGYLKENYDGLVNRLASSSYMNSKRWGRGESDIKTDAEQLLSWLVERKEFLDDYTENSEEFQRVIFEFGWGPMSYYVKKGDILGFLPCEEYGEVDYLADKAYGYGTIIGWQDTEGEEADAGMVVSENIKLYPVYAE